MAQLWHDQDWLGPEWVPDEWISTPSGAWLGQGTAASASITSDAGALDPIGWSDAGSSGAVETAGFAGEVLTNFIAAGTEGSVTLSGFAGEVAVDSAWVGPEWLGPQWLGPFWHIGLTEGVGFVEAGLSADIDVSTYAGAFYTAGQFQGLAATVDVAGKYAGWYPDPEGFLSGFSDPDGDPPSYEIVTQPEAGILSVFVGGAFEWDPDGAPPGRYRFQYDLWAGGEEAADNPQTVYIEHGFINARVSVTTFDASFAYVNIQGQKAVVDVDGFSGEFIDTVIIQGTAATVTLTGYSEVPDVGVRLRGLAGSVTPVGFAGVFSSAPRGRPGELSVTGFAGTLSTGAFFNARGTRADLTVSGFVGDVLTNVIVQGQAATVDTEGFDATLSGGWAHQGTLATVDLAGFAGAIIATEEYTGYVDVQGFAGDIIANQQQLRRDAVAPSVRTIDGKTLANMFDDGAPEPDYIFSNGRTFYQGDSMYD